MSVVAFDRLSAPVAAVPLVPSIVHRAVVPVSIFFAICFLSFNRYGNTVLDCSTVGGTSAT